MCTQFDKRMSHLDLVWAKTNSIFPILNKTLNDSDYLAEDFGFIVAELNRLGIAEQVYETVLLEIDSKLRLQIVPDFWRYFQCNGVVSTAGNSSRSCSTTNKKHENGFFQFQVAVQELKQQYSRIQSIGVRLKGLKEMCSFRCGRNKIQNEQIVLDEMFKVNLLSQLPANFVGIVYDFYTVSFKVFMNSQCGNDGGVDEDGNDDMIDEIVKCNGCERLTDNCRCPELVHVFNTTNVYLKEMNLLDRLAGHTLTTLIQDRITVHVHNQCKGLFDVSHTKFLEVWLEQNALNWLTHIYNMGSLHITAAETQKIVNGFKIKLSYYLYETYANTIIDQFFNIIIDYPDSQPAIEDLKYCLEKMDLRMHLVKSLKLALETRLLHAGVNTNDILTGYVASIKAIRHLDSSGVLLETITEPVKNYMRSRADAVRVVVTALTEDGPADLAEELAKSEATSDDPTNSTDHMINWKTWMPDPVDVNPKKQSGQVRPADIISMVVDIYGSKEMFVAEYRNLLADRLLTQLDFSPEKEIRNLELLKLRFGDSLLHTCEVMLKDIGDSKRIDAHIHSDENYDNGSLPFQITSLILSTQFWPTFKNETLELPAALQAEFEKYTKSYEAYKGNRTLVWRPAIGKVNIEIELTNRTLELAVTPPQAAIIYLFQDKTEWTLDEMCQEIKIPPTMMRKRISLWQSHGLIKEAKPNVFVLIEDANSAQVDELMQTQQQECVDDDEAESAMASASDQREEELQVFWSYIVGMLTNLDSLPLERIHQMLKMFASHGPGVEFSQEELKNFLQRKVRQHELIFSGGVYQLPK